MLEEDKTDIRIARHSITQEDFTPETVCVTMADMFPEDAWKDFNKTILDPAAGTGNLIIECINRRLHYVNNIDDVYTMLNSIYAIELMEDNVAVMKERIFEIVNSLDYNIDSDKVTAILNNNIVCYDTFKWDFDKWAPKKEMKSLKLF